MKISTVVRRNLLARTILGSVIAAALLGCVQRSGEVRADDPRGALEALETRELHARRGIDLTTLDADASTDTVAPGLVHHTLRFAEGPWVVQVLDVNLQACWSVVALKAGGGAVGRARTSELLKDLVTSRRSGQNDERAVVAAGVNADFFRFNPPGVPLTAHIRDGRVIVGPTRRPVLAIGGGGTPSIAFLEDSGVVVIADDTLPLSAWNRPAPEGLSLFDGNWATSTDSATGSVELIVAMGAATGGNGGSGDRQPGPRTVLSGTTLAIDTLPSGVSTHQDRLVLVAGALAPPSLRARLRALRPGIDSVRVQRWIVQRPGIAERDSLESARIGRYASFRGTPREAIGGFPILIGRGLVRPDLDSAGGRGFGPVRHPRTAVGISQMGSHLLLVTVDGRQPGYSVGMTLPELARLLLGLGATAALNLDGGGSTTMALSNRTGMTRIINQPSDTTGERPVSNALAVVHECRESRAEPGNTPGLAP